MTKIGLAVSLSVLFSALAVNVTVAAERTELEEIVVTAQKREQTYLDVPVSVTSISNEVLEMANAREFQDLVQVTPSLTYSESTDMRGSGVLIRGVGTTAFQSGVEPTVSTVVDGVVLGRTGNFLSDLVDIERVEVLRGPQGTLFGKNASAGVVNVITRRPTEDFEGVIRVSATDDDQQTVEGSVSGALTDSLRGRLTGFWKDFDGYLDNRFNGDQFNGSESWGLRGKLDIDLSDNVNLLLIADYSEQDRSCCLATVRNVGQTPDLLPFLAYDLRDLELGADNNEVLISTPTYSNAEQGGLSAELTIDLDRYTFSSITAWRKWDLEHDADVDNMSFIAPTYSRLLLTGNGGTTSTEQLSQEFRITSNGWERVNFTAGLFLWRQDLDRYFERSIEICGFPGFTPGLAPETPCLFPISQYGYFNAEVRSTNAAAFGQVEVDLSDRWRLIAGLRYTYDDLEFDFDRPTAAIAFPSVAPFTGSGGDDDTNLSGKLALQWNVSNSAMLFGSYSRGYKSQGFDVIFGMTPSRFEPVAPELSDAFELGMKSEIWDGRARLGLTLFHTTFDDFQGQAFDAEENAFVLTTAGKVITRGVEFDLTVKPTANLLLNGGIAYTDAYYDEFDNGPCWNGQTAAQGCQTLQGGVRIQDLAGKDLANSPKTKLTLQARYDIPLDGPLNVFVSGAYRWQDETVSTPTQRPSLDIDSYGIMDLNVGIEADSGRWSATVFAKNLFDKTYTNILFETIFDGVDGTSQFLFRDYQRYIGARFEYRFAGQ